MNRILLIISVLFVISGCIAPTFKVKEADTRFSEIKDSLFISENNRISTKSVAGGIHIDAKGVYINPFVSKNRDSGDIVSLGFNIINKTDYDTTFGGSNQLGTIQEVVFRFPDEKLITLDVGNQENQSSDFISYNSVTSSASYDKWETGIIIVTKEQFQQIASATTLSCKITGSKQSVIYEEKDVSPKFIANINQFYNEYVK